MVLHGRGWPLRFLTVSEECNAVLEWATEAAKMVGLWTGHGEILSAS